MSEGIEEVAVIGMSGAFPGARNVRELMDLLMRKGSGIVSLSREECIAAGEAPETVDDPAYVRRGGFLDEADRFDPEFFGMTAAEAAITDPQQRLFLCHSYLALEDSGYDPRDLSVPVGVFAGESVPQFWFTQAEPPTSRNLESFRTMLGNEKDYIATRVSYKLNLKGPSMCVQTACSTGLSCVALACQSLLSWNCDMALAGAASVTAPRRKGYMSFEGMIASKTGDCRPFDAAADGTIFGEGVGVVCLKRLSEAIKDGDFVYAIIKSAAMNNDGSDKVGFTAPSVSGQADAIELAQRIAGVTPDEVGYVETHGTATPLGDPIEIAALCKAFRTGTERRGYCRIGSLKANIGHLDAAAGIAGFIKAVLVVHGGLIPPQANFETANPELRLGSTPFTVNTEIVRWLPDSGRRIAGVSSFGIGGTNVHLVLESPPDPSQSDGGRERPTPVLLSAKSPAALTACKAAVRDFARSAAKTSVAALAAKLSRPMHGFEFRWGSFASGWDDLELDLAADRAAKAIRREPKACFLFPGQGSQFSGMAAAFHGVLPVFTEWLEKGIELAKKISSADLRPFLLEEGFEDEICETENTQPLLYIVEYALAQEAMAAGVMPDAVCGHSIGEYAAAAVAGVMSFEDGLYAVMERGRWMQNAPRGAMTAAAIDPESIASFVAQGLTVSVRNYPGQAVFSGGQEAILRLEDSLEKAGIKKTRLKTSHAFHSPLMESVVEPFGTSIAKLRFGQPRIPFLSNMNGEIVPRDIDWLDYWKRQLRQPVRFDLCAERLKGMGFDVFLESGPGRAVASFIQEAGIASDSVFSLLPRTKAATRFFDKALLESWTAGLPVTWKSPRRSELGPFPGYAFDMRRVESPRTAPQRSEAPQPRTADAGPSDRRGELRAIWKEILGSDAFDDAANFFLLGADSFAGIRLAQAVKDRLGQSLSLPDIMRNPSINGLLGLFTEARPAYSALSPSPFVFPVQTSGSLQPLFLVAGAHENRYFGSGGLIASYEEDFFRYFSAIIGSLGAGQSLYGIKPKGLTLGEMRHFSVESMATHYVEAIKKVQKTGPYFIGGECVGGIVAFEIARQLEARGDEIGRVILLDTPMPSKLVEIRENLSYMRHAAVRIAKWIAFGGRRGADASLPRRLALVTENLKHLVLPLTKANRDMRRILNGSYYYQQTLLRYRPRRIKGPCTFIVNEEWNRKRHMLGWSTELGEGVDFHQVPGNHENRLKKSGALIGEIIRTSIRPGA